MGISELVESLGAYQHTQNDPVARGRGLECVASSQHVHHVQRRLTPGPRLLLAKFQQGRCNLAFHRRTFVLHVFTQGHTALGTIVGAYLQADTSAAGGSKVTPSLRTQPCRSSVRLVRGRSV